MSLTTYTTIPNSDIDPESPITTTLMTNLRNNPIAMIQADTSAPDQWCQRDPALVNHGDGSDGAVTLSATANFAQYQYQATTFTINAGVTMTATSSPIIIRATTSITIAGTINARGADISAGAAQADLRIGGGGGGGGGSGVLSSYASAGNSVAESIIYYRTDTGASGGAVGVVGTAGYAVTAADTATALNKLSGLIDSRGGGGGAGGKDEPNVSATGGLGGGLVILIAPTITVTGTIDVSGANGSSAGTYGGGGGGGGGGVILCIGQTITESASPYTVSGGSGGSAGVGGGAGGAGADGWQSSIRLT